MLSAEEQMEAQCAESLARVRAIAGAGRLGHVRSEVDHWLTKDAYDEARGDDQHERDLTGTV